MLSLTPQRHLSIGRPRSQSLLEVMSILNLPKSIAEVALKALPYHLRGSRFRASFIIRFRQSSHKLLLQSLRPFRLSRLAISMIGKVSMTLMFLPVLKKSIEVFNQELLPSRERYPAFSLLLLIPKGVMHLGYIFLMYGGAFLCSIAEFAGICLQSPLLLIVMIFII